MRIPYIMMATLLVALTASHSDGSVLSYAPDFFDLPAASGTETTVSLTVTLNPTERASYSLQFIDKVVNGNLPVEWLQASPTSAFVNGLNRTATTTLTIRVPEGTPPGVYSGVFLSKAMAAHGLADPGSGAVLKVTVSSRCSQPPAFQITSYGPETLWPPDHKMRQITISGQVTVPEGCQLSEAGYHVEDEYGTYTTDGSLTLHPDGRYSLTLSLEAWRNGNDKDGRHYRITLHATDEAGTGTSPPLEILVPHDQGGK